MSTVNIPDVVVGFGRLFTLAYNMLQFTTDKLQLGESLFQTNDQGVIGAKVVVLSNGD